jgi:hypothetical protein
VGDVPRRTAVGWDLKLWLEASLAREISVEELRGASGLSRHKWYGDRGRGIAGRSEADDFPNAEEARKVADHFGVSLTELLIEFALVDFEDFVAYVEHKGGTAPRPCSPSLRGVVGRIMGANRYSIRPDLPPA